MHNQLPVISLSLLKLGRYVQNKYSREAILEALPYLGLDIEGVEGDAVDVEYSPNRADFSSEAGVARSLVGLLGIKTGLPEYHTDKSDYEIIVESDEILSERPFVFGIYCELYVSEEILKQLITMQEDLHNGLGRKRSSVSIGIHNADPITNKIRYRATRDRNFAFVPLGSTQPMKISEVLSRTEQGQQYGRLVSSGIYPVLEDSRGNLLSLPPIINGELTRLKEGVSKIFVDVTATDERSGDAVTAIITSMLADIGGKVKSVLVVRSGNQSKTFTPDMTPHEMKFDLSLCNKLLGLDLNQDDARICLEKSRLGLSSNGMARIPRFRADIIHPVDLAEEVALGYSVAKLEPQRVLSSLSGSLNRRLTKIDSIIDILIGLGLTEIWNLSMVGKEIVALCDEPLSVEDSKSQSFDYLRCDLATSLLRVLGASTSLEYPQRIFEVAPTFARSKDANQSGVGVSENVHACSLLADSEMNYTSARSILDALLRAMPTVHDGKIAFSPLREQEKSVFLEGRSAHIAIETKTNESIELGVVGEISPVVLVQFGISVPVAGFELNLEPILKE